MDVNELIVEFLKNNKKYLYFYILFMIAYPMSSVFLPKYYGEIVESVKNHKVPKFKTAFILIIVVQLMFFVLNKMDEVFIPKLQAYIRVNIVTEVLKNYKGKYKEQELGSLISKIVKLPIVVRDLVRTVRHYIFPLLLILLLVVVRFTMIDKRIGVLVALGLVIMAIICIPMAKNCIEK